jgi:hypothetical protein
MKLLLMASLLFAAHDFKCQDSDSGIDKKISGQIVYEITDPVCLTNREKGQATTQCSTMSVVDHDYCLNDNKLVEQYCDQATGQPSKKEIFCQCIDGVCKKH